MATVSWGTFKSLLLFFGPILLPKAIRWYRNLRSGQNSHGLRVRPLPAQAFRAIILLVIATACFLVLTIPLFAPSNVFVQTQSRLQIPTDVLFNRVASLRPDNVLTTADSALRSKFVNLESRLLFLQFGPDVLAECPFCNSDNPRSYFYYALPGLLAPHLVNLVVMALATAEPIAGRDGLKWRSYITIAAALGGMVDIYLVNSYNYQLNARATRLQDLDMFFWSSRVYRYAGLAALDIVFATLLYLSATNRAFATPLLPTERVEMATRLLLSTKAKLSAVGVVKNTAIRDEELRGRALAYWQHEGHVMRQMMEEREVVEGVNDALANRINIQNIMKDADTYASNLLPNINTTPVEAQPAPETIVG